VAKILSVLTRLLFYHDYITGCYYFILTNSLINTLLLLFYYNIILPFYFKSHLCKFIVAIPVRNS